MNIQRLIPAAIGAMAILGVALPNAAVAAVNGESVTNVRDATASYNDPAVALAGGYDLLTDSADIACIDQPGEGAMGIHYVKGALVQAGKVDPARPQALVYERSPEGKLALAAVEYVVLKDGWDADHGAPPSLFGQQFMLTQAGNRYGLPAFYSLHAWVWKDNPNGMFSMYNPAASCEAATP